MIVMFCFQDAHNAILKYDTDSSLFAVYDGHGGHEVAKYCAQRLPNFIKNNEDYQKGEIDKVKLFIFAYVERLFCFSSIIVYQRRMNYSITRMILVNLKIKKYFKWLY